MNLLKGAVPLKLLGGKDIISVDFGSSEMKVVQGKYSKKNIMISKSFSLSLPKDIYMDGEIQDMDQLSYLFRNALSENKMVGKEAYGVINSTKVIMREITMPKVENSQIESVLKYQLEEYLPVNPEEYVVKFINLGLVLDDGIEKLNILLVGVPRIIVESHFNLFRNVGLKPAALDHSGNAISKLIHFGESINNSFDSRDTIASIDMGYESTVLTITEQGVMKVSRSTDVGVKDMIIGLGDLLGLSEEEIIDNLNDIDDVNDEFDININSTEYKLVEGIKSNLINILDRTEMIFRYYKTRDVGNEINLILLLGGMSKINGIEKLCENYLNTPCVKLISLDKVKFGDNLSNYSNAIGALIRLDEV